MPHRFTPHRLLMAIAIVCLLLSTATTTLAADNRVYTDEELENMPAPGPNPYLSFLPAEAEVDWNYWHQKRDYENRKRSDAMAELELAGVVAEVEPNDTQATAQLIAGFGTGSGEDAAIDVTGSIGGGGDIDCFEIDLELGDILGVNQTGGAGFVEIFAPGGELQHGSDQSGAFLYPPSSPMPGGANTADLLTYLPGGHVVCVRNGSGAYTLQLRGFRSVLESAGQQTLFVDFDGAMIDPALFDGPPGVVSLSPLSAFLAGWGLTPGDEDAVIDAIMASIEENITADLALAANPAFGVEILNSRDHADPFGDPNVSRLIVGGTIGEFGIGTIGIAQSIDPGNFETEESGVILLDLLSAGAANPNSLNQFGLGGGATIIDLVGVGVGNIVAHEAGHYLGNWHTENVAAGSDPSIMDRGGNLAGTVGVGPDNIFGTADDFDTDFSPDQFSIAEGFTGTQHTDQKTAFGLTGTSIFTDGFESGDTTAWSSSTP